MDINNSSKFVFVIWPRREWRRTSSKNEMSEWSDEDWPNLTVTIRTQSCSHTNTNTVAFNRFLRHSTLTLLSVIQYCLSTVSLVQDCDGSQRWWQIQNLSDKSISQSGGCARLISDSRHLVDVSMFGHIKRTEWRRNCRVYLQHQNPRRPWVQTVHNCEVCSDSISGSWA